MSYSNQSKYSAGFTVIESLVALAIGVLLTTIVFYSFSSFKNNSSLRKNVSQAKSILEEARSLSISEKSDTSYGVHLQSDRLVAFHGSTYISTSTSNTIYLFDGATLDNISLNGGGSDVTFDKITGGTNKYGTFRIKLSSDANQKTTIRVARTGIISEE